MTPKTFAPTLPTGLRRLSAVCLLSLPLFSLSALPALSQVAGLHAAPGNIAPGQTSPSQTSQSASSILSLEPALGSKVNAELSPTTGMPLPEPPANFRRMTAAQPGELSPLETLSIRFSASARLGKITSTPDFPIEQGSSCIEGNTYESGQTCTLLVRFTPKGAGNRYGRIAIENSASITPFYVGLGGNGYAPVVSFTPAVISTVPSSYPASKGLLSGAMNLAVDGGDTLYVADTGNNVIRAMDASGVFTTISSGTLNAPLGVTADNFGEVFFTEPSQNALFEIYAYGPLFLASGATTATCTTAAPCQLSASKVFTPGEMAVDSYNRIFFVDAYAGAAEFVAQSTSASYAHLGDPFTYQNSAPGVMTVDSSDNIYSYWDNSSVCSISMQSFYNAANSYAVYQKVAGGKTCGFAGDGGQARNAEISSTMGQMTVDIAGNLYFTDTGNQRVRRIDAATGIINTIAGAGVASYGGDGGAATLAYLANPTGVAVDSQGQVYIISGTAATGTSQVIRKLGPDGAIPFGNVLRNTSSIARTITLSNTGNSALTFTSYHFTGPAAAEYTVDPNTTTCLLTAGSTLANGQSCKVGVIFKPTSASVRQATLQFFDNTVTNINNVQLYGVGTLPTPTFAFTAPASGASFTSGTAVTVSVSVTSTTTPAPTGNVKFSVDGAFYGSPVTVAANGTASVSMTGLTTANHTIGALYSGDANYSTLAITRPISVTAAKATPSVALAAKTTPATTCKALVYGATVNSTSLATGTIQLKEGSTILTSATLSSGTATLTTPTALSAGNHTLTAFYAGDATHNAASVNLVQTVTASTVPCTKTISSPVRISHRPQP